MMGWQVPERFRDTYRLVFADPEFHGLQVVVRRQSFGAFRATAALTTLDRDKVAAGQIGEAEMAKLDAVLAELGAALVSWNLQDDDGQPVPCTIQALDRQDLVFGLELLDAWMVGVAQTQLPTRPEPVDEADLPMQALN